MKGTGHAQLGSAGQEASWRHTLRSHSLNILAWLSIINKLTFYNSLSFFFFLSFSALFHYFLRLFLLVVVFFFLHFCLFFPFYSAFVCSFFLCLFLSFLCLILSLLLLLYNIKNEADLQTSEQQTKSAHCLQRGESIPEVRSLPLKGRVVSCCHETLGVASRRREASSLPPLVDRDKRRCAVINLLFSGQLARFAKRASQNFFGVMTERMFHSTVS